MKNNNNKGVIMEGKPFLVLSVVLTLIACLYFFFFGFSPDRFTRWGQYAGLGFAFLVVLDNFLRS